MDNWINIILKEVITSNKILFVTDETNLLKIETIKDIINEEGYKLLEHKNNLDFRILWETEYKKDENKYIIGSYPKFRENVS